MKFTPLIAMTIIAVASANESAPWSSHSMMPQPHKTDDAMHSASPTYVACPGDDMDDHDDMDGNNGKPPVGGGGGDDGKDNDNANNGNDNDNNGKPPVGGGGGDDMDNDNDNDMDNDNDNDGDAQPTTPPVTGAGATNAIGSLAVAGAIAAYVL